MIISQALSPLIQCWYIQALKGTRTHKQCAETGYHGLPTIVEALTANEKHTNTRLRMRNHAQTNTDHDQFGLHNRSGKDSVHTHNTGVYQQNGR